MIFAAFREDVVSEPVPRWWSRFEWLLELAAGGMLVALVWGFFLLLRRLILG